MERPQKPRHSYLSQTVEQRDSYYIQLNRETELLNTVEQRGRLMYIFEQGGRVITPRKREGGLMVYS